MTELKDVSRRQTEIEKAIDCSGLLQISQSYVNQTSALRKAVQEATDVQNRLISDAIQNSGLIDIVESLNRALAPTKALITNFSNAINGNLIGITALQNFGNITLKLKEVDSVTEQKTAENKTSCLVAMSADVEEKHDAGKITYENSASVQIEAEIKDLKANQQLILEHLASDRNDSKNAISAEVRSIRFVDNECSIIEIDGNRIRFSSGIAPTILHWFFGRKNFSKNRKCSVDELFEKITEDDWFELPQKSRQQFQNKVYQSVRNINNRFLETTKKYEKLIVQSERNTYTLNPKLFK